MKSLDKFPSSFCQQRSNTELDIQFLHYHIVIFRSNPGPKIELHAVITKIGRFVVRSFLIRWNFAL